MSDEELGELLGGGGLGEGDEMTGDIYIPSNSEGEDEGTLDESVFTTLKRDMKAILIKCTHVLVPVRSNKKLLHDWDLWGPLLLCITLAMLLHGRANDPASGQHTIHFLNVFLLVWGGAAVVTVNTQLLRGKVSFFQSVCTIGYCLLPLATALILSRLLLIYSTQGSLIFFVRLAIIVAAVFWSSWASLGFLADYLPSDRKALAIYPILLFYFCIGFLILAQNKPLI
ncbi:protein YIPF6 homolog [Halichondria panicea]|uniref:protein YIPF6 homolog n=1 Tax=Halichondria panicea TaxID=6063 RepID=UPI00312B521C